MKENFSSSIRLIYVECGTTANSAVNTGIQRVVRNIVKELTVIDSKYNIEVVPVAFSEQGFLPVSNLLERPDTSEEVTPDFKPRLKTFMLRVDRLVRRVCKFGLYQYLRSKLKDNIKSFFISQEKSDAVPLLSMSNNRSAILLLLDSTWDNRIWSHVDSFKSKGGSVSAVLYDTIPFTHPETVEDTTRVAHTSWWLEAPKYVDSVMCISKTVRRDYLDWQRQNNIATALPPDKVNYFYLGSELAQHDPVVSLLTSDVPYFLMVGSFEPRKNHKTVLKAFEILWEREVPVRLAFVGAHGWKSEALMEYMQTHPELNKQLFLILNASDRDLSALYGQATGLIIASLAEGFGLPIVEAFQRGTAVICSDIPVFREVAGDRARYFETLDSTDLANQVVAEIREQQPKRQKAMSQQWISWQESAEELLLKINQMN